MVFAAHKSSVLLVFRKSVRKNLRKNHEEIPMKGEIMKSEKSGYDPYSAVTFLLIGLGLGAVFGMVFNPKTKQRVSPEGINRRRPPAMQPQEEAKEPVA
jgi:hypothetical protein